MERTHAEIEENASERLIDQWSYTPSFMPPRQEYVVLSVVDDGQGKLALKVYGCFPTLEKANEFAARAAKECDAFDIFTLETAQWARLPPEIESLEDAHYTQSRLEELKRRAAGSRDAAAQRLRERIFQGSTPATAAAIPDTEAASTATVDSATAMDM